MCDFVKASFLTCSIQKQMQECKAWMHLHISQITWLHHNTTFRWNKQEKHWSPSNFHFAGACSSVLFTFPSTVPALVSSHDPPEVSFHTLCRLARVPRFPLCMSPCLKHTHCPLRLPGSPSCLSLPHLFWNTILRHEIYSSSLQPIIYTYPFLPFWIYSLCIFLPPRSVGWRWWLLASCPFTGAARDLSQLVSPLVFYICKPHLLLHV